MSATALRGLRKRSGFTSVAVLTLALGIGANTSIFSVVDAVLLEPLPYPDSDRLVKLTGTSPRQGRLSNLSLPDFGDFETRAPSFGALGALSGVRSLTLTGSGEPERVPALSVSPTRSSPTCSICWIATRRCRPGRGATFARSASCARRPRWRRPRPSSRGSRRASRRSIRTRTSGKACTSSRSATPSWATRAAPC